MLVGNDPRGAPPQPLFLLRLADVLPDSMSSSSHPQDALWCVKYVWRVKGSEGGRKTCGGERLGPFGGGKAERHAKKRGKNEDPE